MLAAFCPAADGELPQRTSRQHRGVGASGAARGQDRRPQHARTHEERQRHGVRWR